MVCNMQVYAILILLPSLTLAGDKLKPGQIDADKDGKFSLDETTTYFLAHDSDKDGEITLAEFTTAVDNIDPAFVGHELFLFTVFDHDANKQISKSDIDFAFKIADMNNDSYIGTWELYIAIKLTSLTGVIID